ncbi:MAG: A1S_2505 family phage non-structural protein [Acidithiobacillus sp.]
MMAHKDHTTPKVPAIFVFGSNLAGRHGAGAAKVARLRFGAEYGVGQGRTGNAYAIATKNANLCVLSVEDVRYGVDCFLEYAKGHPELQFFVTRVGCGLAGFADADIAPMFRGAPDNCDFPEEWEAFL